MPDALYVPYVNPTLYQLLRAAGLRLTAASAALTILGVPRQAETLEQLLRLLLAVLLWECFRCCIQGAELAKGRWILLLLLSGLLSIASLQVFSAAVEPRTATALLFAFATSGIAVWLQRRGEALAAWSAEFLSLWTLAFTSFLVLSVPWSWQPLAVAGAFAAALSAPLLADLYMSRSLWVGTPRLYAGLTWTAPLIVAGLTVVHALPAWYGAVLLYLPITHPLHTSLYSDPSIHMKPRPLFSAALLFPALVALISMLSGLL